MGMSGMRFDQGSRRDRIKMLGNAVCPPVMRQAIRHLTGVRSKMPDEVYPFRSQGPVTGKDCSATNSFVIRLGGI